MLKNGPSLIIQCIGKRRIKHESIEPAQVEIPVRKEYAGSAYAADTQAEQARRLSVSKKPYVEIASGKRHYAQNAVEISLPRQNRLKNRSFGLKLGISSVLHLWVNTKLAGQRIEFKTVPAWATDKALRHTTNSDITFRRNS
jgi:hypothetical protein